MPRLTAADILAASSIVGCSGMSLELFQTLDALLERHHVFWQFEPMQASWPTAWPRDLQAYLGQLSFADCAAIDSSAILQAEALARFFPDVFAALPQLPCVSTQATSLPFWLHTDVPGRKWQQICHFSAAMSQTGTDSTAPVLEWCAGKGHVGRLLAFQGARSVTSLEWQAELCFAGTALSHKHGMAQHFHAVDVLNQDTHLWFDREQRFVAMHACGDLHRRGIDHACQHQLKELAVLPCCYHLQAAAWYQPRSRAAQQSTLRLNKAMLRLAVQQQATAGARVQRLGHQEMLWRHAWMQWTRRCHVEQVPGTCAASAELYRPLRSIPKQLLSAGLAEFFAYAAAQHQLPLPAVDLWPSLLADAELSLLQQRRLELVQHVFRRPLELWLVLDLQLQLEEAGYRVELLQMCEAELTPRNLLIRAWR